jgi:hypothetical protein
MVNLACFTGAGEGTRTLDVHLGKRVTRVGIAVCIENRSNRHGRGCPEIVRSGPLRGWTSGLEP